MTAVATPPADAPARVSSLMSALLAFAAEAPKLPKDKSATVTSQKGSYKYAYTSLDTIAERVHPLLIKHGLVWITKPDHDERGPTLNYELVYAETGEGVRGSMPLLLAKDDSQGLGSAITYARRYAIVAVLNLIADEDDDGASASSSGYGSAQSPATPAGTQNLQQHARGLSDEQLVAAFKKAGISVPNGSLFMACGRVPDQNAAALYAALQAVRL